MLILVMLGWDYSGISEVCHHGQLRTIACVTCFVLVGQPMRMTNTVLPAERRSQPFRRT
jgi:hypothetical protein